VCCSGFRANRAQRKSVSDKSDLDEEEMAELEVGAAVLGNYEGSGEWYAGKLTKVTSI
jgi:hypothetical protein